MSVRAQLTLPVGLTNSLCWTYLRISPVTGHIWPRKGRQLTEATAVPEGPPAPGGGRGEGTVAPSTFCIFTRRAFQKSQPRCQRLLAHHVRIRPLRLPHLLVRAGRGVIPAAIPGAQHLDRMISRISCRLI